MGNCFNTEEERPMNRAEDHDGLDLTQHDACEASLELHSAPHMQSDYAPPETVGGSLFRNMYVQNSSPRYSRTVIPIDIRSTMKSFDLRQSYISCPTQDVVSLASLVSR